MAGFSHMTFKQGPMKVVALVVFMTGLPLQLTAADRLLLPVRNLRLAIHVFQDDGGQGNFRQDSADTDFLNRVATWINDRLANLDTLKPDVKSPFIADSRVRIRIDSIFYHSDSRAWDCSSEIDSPYMRSRYVDGDSSIGYRQKYQTLPVFIGANHPVIGGHTQGIGDRGYIAVRGYFESYQRDPLARAVDECGRNLVHELGHCLGLLHNFTGGPQGDQCDGCEDNGCPTEGTSNNIMDYWPSYGYALSGCQFDLIHFHLNGNRGNISEIVVNDSCYSFSGAPEVVRAGDTTEITDTVYAHRDLLIRTGGKLLVTGLLSMPGEAKITLEPGGILEIRGGTITNLCGDLWLGIRVENSGSGQPSTISAVNGGILENARAAIRLEGPATLVLNAAVFRNCIESLVFLNGSVDSAGIENCSFLVTTRLNHYEEGLTLLTFIRSEGVGGLSVKGCRFVNEPGTVIFDADWMGTGISTDAQYLQIGESEFRNLTTGLEYFSSLRESAIQITDNHFTNNKYGLKSRFSGLQWISGNRFSMQRFNTGGTVGMYLVKPDRFVISLNHFESEYGGGQMSGVVLKDPSQESSAVFHNDFSNLPVGILLDGPPDIDSTLLHWARNPGSDDLLKLGPQFRFNDFSSVSLNLAVVVDSACGVAAGQPDQVREELVIPATDWCLGGYAWYANKVPMVAFKGWHPLTIDQSGHGFYWFMNYLGYAAREDIHTGSDGFRPLINYLNQFAGFADSPDHLFDDGIYPALASVSRLPAVARSARLAAGWEIPGAEDVRWLRESLSAIAARFTREDSLLTDLGTSLASDNIRLWKTDLASVSMHWQASEVPPENLEFVFPDLDAFRFFRPENHEPGQPPFSVYPNPATEYILIGPSDGYSFVQPLEGWLIGPDGRYYQRIRIESWEEQRLNITSLPAGTCFIELFSGIQYLGAVKFIKITH